jgi:hypothetical protein
MGPVLRTIANIFGLFIIAIALSAPPRAFAAERPSDIPAWLWAHVGEGEGQIAQVVLRRARALFAESTRGRGQKSLLLRHGRYASQRSKQRRIGAPVLHICEADRSFRAISAGHGSGRVLKGIVDFANGRRCAKNFGNALDSKLTAGGAYVTAETKTSFKGYYRISTRRDAVLIRAFVQFNGEGETANARQREIGGHAAELLRNVCLRKNPHSPYADRQGYVAFGERVDYAGGRSDGCISWSPTDAGQITAMVKDAPTTLYIYPAAADIDAVARAVAAGQSLSSVGLYWNAACLKEIGSPKFWPKESLEPIIAQFKKDHPASPPRPTPICKES